MKVEMTVVISMEIDLTHEDYKHYSNSQAVEVACSEVHLENIVKTFNKNNNAKVISASCVTESEYVLRRNDN